MIFSHEDGTQELPRGKVFDSFQSLEDFLGPQSFIDSDHRYRPWDMYIGLRLAALEVPIQAFDLQTRRAYAAYWAIKAIKYEKALFSRAKSLKELHRKYNLESCGVLGMFVHHAPEIAIGWFASLWVLPGVFERSGVPVVLELTNLAAMASAVGLHLASSAGFRGIQKVGPEEVRSKVTAALVQAAITSEQWRKLAVSQLGQEKLVFATDRKKLFRQLADHLMDTPNLRRVLREESSAPFESIAECPGVPPSTRAPIPVGTLPYALDLKNKKNVGGESG